MICSFQAGCAHLDREMRALPAENWEHLWDCCCLQGPLPRVCLPTSYLLLSSQAQVLPHLHPNLLRGYYLEGLGEFYSETKWQHKLSTLRRDHGFLGLSRAPSYSPGTPSMVSRRRNLFLRGIIVSFSILTDRLESCKLLFYTLALLMIYFVSAKCTPNYS